MLIDTYQLQKLFSMLMGNRTIAKIVHETCLAIWEELVSDLMSVLTEEKLEKVAMDYYNRWGYPNCTGSLDGKHC